MLILRQRQTLPFMAGFGRSSALTLSKPRALARGQSNGLIPQEAIASKILLVRGRRVILDRDLAKLYGVSTGRLNEQVKRNKERFPEDFMFQLTKEELEKWISQIAISNSEKMGLRKLPYVFTDYGILMLSSVLKSKRAVQVNIVIMRVFVKFREFLTNHKEFAEKISELEKRMENKDKEIQAIFEVIRQLMFEPKKIKPKIGFHGREDK